MESEISLQVILIKPTKEVVFGLQKGSGSNYETVQKQDTIQKLSSYTEKEILKIHGIGKASLPAFRKSLEEQGLAFKSLEDLNPI